MDDMVNLADCLPYPLFVFNKRYPKKAFSVVAKSDSRRHCDLRLFKKKH